MRFNLSAPFIRYPIATSLVMVAILLMGVAAFPRLPVAALPQIDFPTVRVQAALPGASPDTMATSVAQPLERQFAQIPGVAVMTSTSSLGSTSISVQFELGRDVDAGAQDIQAAINAAAGELPRDLPSPPIYRKVNPADPPILIIGGVSDTLPLTEVNSNLDARVGRQVSQLAGVGEVIVGGEQKPAIRIQIDPAKLVAKNISLDEVRAALGVATVNQPKGTIDGERRSFTIYANDQLSKPSEWNEVILSYRNGAAVRVRDVGQAVAGPEDSRKAAWVSGQRGVYLVIFKQPDANVVQVVDSIKAELPRLQASLPPSMRLEIVSDRTQTIRASLHEVEITLGLTIALVVLVIFLFLRSFWATAIPSVTVPISLAGTFALMYLAGYSLNNLSLMALIIAVTFVVDDAIVMLENIVRRVEEGESPMEAAYRGSAEIGFTILSISVSLVAVFIPLLLMGGIIGRLFREFAMTVTIMIAVSALVALTLTPMMAARLLSPPREGGHGRLYGILERGFAAVDRAYARSLDVALRARFVTLLVFLGTIALTGVLFWQIPKGFFPQQDTGLLIGTSQAAEDISYAEMVRRQEAALAVIASDPAVAGYSAQVGGTNSLNEGRVFISLKPLGERDATIYQVINRLRPKLERVQGIRMFLQAAQDINVGGRRTRTQFQYTLQDPDSATLREWTPRVEAALSGLPELRDVTSDQSAGGGMLSVTIDRDQAARYGITPSIVDNLLYNAFGQRQVAQYFTQIDTFRVIMEILPELQGQTEILQRLHVKSPLTGEQVPLAAFASWSTRGVAPLSVNHQGQFPAATISFNLAPGVSLGQATEAIQAAERQIRLPASTSGSFQGNAQEFQRSLATVPLLILAALIAVYISLGILYESLIHPLTILSTLPSAGLGALAVLMAAGFDFSLIALIGVILLIGIVKKNGIMLVDVAIAAERDEHLTAAEAVRKAALLRFRPILMTTLAAILGGIPLALGFGAGAEIRQPLGYAMVGGLAVSQVLTLYTTPVVYIYLDEFAGRLSGWFGRGRTRERGDAPVPAAAE
ncbi:efflux RND transporter permease subunit [Enterovirga sp.]|uniref:efflux RND transporter permease subunit n=1 Tax=Enterovirga sp. TaxID=2026350 RepID=UPI0026027C1B|nr:efflux RND transporter permease subunit [Enterovirga sp.]MDB5592835.1 acriflavin resistance protein [Enterovirga sp.]